MNLQRKLGLHYFKFLLMIVLMSFILYFFLLVFYAILTRISSMAWLDEINTAGALLVIVLAFMLPIVAFFLISGFIYGRKMSAPIFYYLKWVDHLSEGNYSAPSEKKYVKIKNMRFFSLFQELTEKMEKLTNRLQQNEIERKELEKMRREWTSGVTHDLKTPLSYIQGYSTMLLSKEHNWTEEEQTHFISIMQEKAAHMQHLIDDLSDAFQFEQGMLSLERESIDMVAFLHKLVEDIKQQPNALQHDFEFHSAKEKLIYSFDSYLMKRALTNFLMNAVIHNSARTKINVLLEQSDEMLVITVSDNGIGMETREKELLFQRYYRGTSTDSSVSGTGLGMAIAKQFIVAHRGTIDVKSSLGHGTSIIVSLPYSL